MEEKKQKRQSVYKVVMLVVLVATITFMGTTLVMYNKFSNVYDLNYSASSGSQSTSETSGLLKTLEKFKAMLEQKYIGEIDEEKMIESAIKGYVDGLEDPYTTYLTKEEMEEFTEETNGEYIGIGVYLTADTSTNTILIIGIINNSPAQSAGLQAGDIIEKVDGVEYTGEQMNEAVKVLKGKEGTQTELTILRDDKELTVTVVRKTITLEHVASQMLDNKIAYIQIDAFDDGVAEDFEEQITELTNKGATGIIIDLRSNGGGIVDEATDIADLFLEKGETILITQGKEKGEKITKSAKNPIIKDIPVVILVNEGTASASEILAGALRDNYGATIVGKTTYGKGVIQTLYTLSDGSGLKITTDEYFTPNHNEINNVGIEPDVEVDLTKDEDGYYETGFDKDAQILKAIEILKKQ